MYEDEDIDKAILLHKMGHFTELTIYELAERIYRKRKGI